MGDTPDGMTTARVQRDAATSADAAKTDDTVIAVEGKSCLDPDAVENLTRRMCELQKTDALYTI